MPYTKSIVAGIIIFILLFPALGAYPYKGSDNISKFDLVVPKMVKPLTVSLTLEASPEATYGATIEYKVYNSSSVGSLRPEFYGFGGINGTIQNAGEAALYFGITDYQSFYNRYVEYNNETFAGNSDPLLKLMSISKFAYIVPGERDDVSMPLLDKADQLVLRVLPSPHAPGNVKLSSTLNIRPYITLSDYMTRFVFMADTTFKNFTITISTKTLGSFYVYVGITPANLYVERMSTLGDRIQYRESVKVAHAISELSLHYSSRSKLMTRSAFGNMPEMTKGYYIMRAIAYYQADIVLDVSMSSQRPSVSSFVRLRVIIVLLIALRRPFKMKREIEYLLKK